MVGRMKKILLAKSSGETLAGHTAWCLKAARALLTSLPQPEMDRREIKTDVLLAVALHDAGKAASGFQRVLRGDQTDWGGKRHEILSAAVASALPSISPAVLMAILTHHRDIPADVTTDPYLKCLPQEQLPWKNDQTPVWDEMAREWRENEPFFIREWVKICRSLRRDDLACANLELSDLALSRTWMNRSAGRYGQRRAISFSERYYGSVVRGLVISADHLGSAHCVPRPIPDLKSYSVLRTEPRPFQKQAGKTEGSAILRAPTGSGKTEAALLWAQENQRPNGRLFYVLPYTASINAMYRRLGPGVPPCQSGIFSADNVGVLHSKSTSALYSMLESNGEMCSKLDRQENAKALSSLAREMWFPIRVCTPHQILRHILRGKGWESMLAEFPNACFIFDEVHAYDPRVVGLTLATARTVSRWGVRNLFVSATLPRFLEKLIQDAIGPVSVLVPDGSLTGDRAILDRKRHAVEMLDGRLTDKLEDIIHSAESGRSTLIVCNHVRTAQVVYERVKDRIRHDVVLLHSRFNQEDRNRIEAELLAGSVPRVLVATQVVEVSLDLDFDQAFMEPAPIDALIQRMGRVNRAGRRAPAPVFVFTEQVNKNHLYCQCDEALHDSACRVRRSIEALRAVRSPLSEKDLVDAANWVYEAGYQGRDRESFFEGFSHPDITKFEERLLVGAHQDWVEQVVERTDGTVEVLPTSLEAEYEARLQKGMWIEASALLVPIRLRSLGAMRTKLNTSTEPWLLNCSYSSTKGLES